MSTELGEKVHDNLFAGTQQLPVAQGVDIIASDVGVRGQVMGKITASGKWIKRKSGATDGSEIPRGIAAESYDASAADSKTVVYKTGQFNEDAIVFDGVDTLTEEVKNLLQGVNIHTIGTIDVAGVHN